LNITKSNIEGRIFYAMNLLPIIVLQKKLHVSTALKNAVHSDIVVMKFGGSSVGSAFKILHVADVIHSLTENQRTVVVVSAMQGVTDMLIKIFQNYQEGNMETALHDLQELSYTHFETLKELQLQKELFRESNDLLASLFEKIRLFLLSKQKFTKQDYDYVISFGERFNSILVTAALRGRGVESRAVDSADCIVVTNQFSNAKALSSQTKIKSRKTLLPLLNDGIIPVVTGFFGMTESGDIAILGRGGSDYSATILACTLHAKEVILWKEVDGVYNGDPHVDKDAEFYAELSYTEALRLAQNGAKILHPEAMKPVCSEEIPVVVRNTFNPSHCGTRIWKGAV
jgi:aspartate kinase